MLAKLRTVRALHTGISIIDQSGFFIPPADVERGIERSFRFVLGYLWLAYAAHLDNRRAYKLRPKWLGLQHGLHGVVRAAIQKTMRKK